LNHQFYPQEIVSSLDLVEIGRVEGGQSTRAFVQVADGDVGTAGRRSAVAHQWLVVVEEVHGMLMLPASPAEVLEAVQVAAEVRALAETAGAAQSILQVGVDLNL